MMSSVSWLWLSRITGICAAEPAGIPLHTCSEVRYSWTCHRGTDDFLPVGRPLPPETTNKASSKKQLSHCKAWKLLLSLRKLRRGSMLKTDCKRLVCVCVNIQWVCTTVTAIESCILHAVMLPDFKQTPPVIPHSIATLLPWFSRSRRLILLWPIPRRRIFRWSLTLLRCRRKLQRLRKIPLSSWGWV